MVAHRINPQVKVEAGATEISTDTITVAVYRIENAVSRCHLSANDYKGKNYIANITKFTVLKVSLRYGSDAWTQVFEGIVESVGPVINSQGQTLTAVAYGYGRALRNTHCHVNYGKESENSSLDQPTEIWDDLVANRINKNFDGAATGYALTDTKIKTVTTPSINFIKGGYRTNLEILNQVCLLNLADEAGSAGVHWWVDPSKNLWIDTIGAHSVDTGTYPTYWKILQADSTLVEGTDFKQTNFTYNTRNFANKVLLMSDLRKPGYDYLTEDSGGQALWGNDALKSKADSATSVVGSHSLDLESNGAAAGYGYFPSAENAGWNITLIGSEVSIPHLNFYYRKDANIAELTTYVHMFTTDHKTAFFYATFSNWHTDPDNEWVHVSLPIGPYWKSASENRRFRWVTSGAADWTNINGIAFNLNLAGGDAHLLIDDLHIQGKIIREAYNSTSIAADKEHQKIVKLDVAVDDTMDASDDSGTAAQLAYAELLTAQTAPVTGQVTCPMIVDIYPGQLVHIHSDYYGTNLYRVDLDFRVQQIIHTVNRGGAKTILDLTADVKNTFAIGHASSPSAQLSALSKALFVDPEAKSLKSGAVDELISRLSIDYP